jgi:hypothetical protein
VPVVLLGREDCSVIGGTGFIGSRVVAKLGADGHEAVAASRSTGVNTLTGEGLADALAGASVVIDVSNVQGLQDAEMLEFFETSTQNLLAAAAPGVRHYVALSVVGCDGLPDLAHEEQERIQRDLDQAQRILETSEMIYEHIQGTLERTLELLERVDEVYRLGSPRIRQMLNQCFFTRLLLDGEPDGSRVTGSTLREPWATLLADDFQARMRHNTRNSDRDLLGRGSIMKTLVPPAGFEPATPALGERCSIP